MPRKRKVGDAGRPSTYTYSREHYEVSLVTGWRLNMTARMLEWRVLWVGYDELTWEPNCNAHGYSDAIFAFLGSNPGPPARYEE